MHVRVNYLLLNMEKKINLAISFILIYQVT